MLQLTGARVCRRPLALHSVASAFTRLPPCRRLSPVQNLFTDVEQLLGQELGGECPCLPACLRPACSFQKGL